MFDSIVNLFIFFSSGLILLMAFAQIITTKRHILNLINFIILFCLGLLQVQLLLIFVEMKQHVSLFYFLHLTTLYAAGPACYLYLLVHSRTACQLKTREIIHLAPAFVMLLLEITIQLLPDPMRSAIIGDMITRNFSAGVNPFMLIRFFGFMHIACYLIAYLHQFFNIWHVSEMPAESRISLYSVIHVLVALMILIISQIIEMEVMSKVGIILLSLVSMYWYFVSYKCPEFFYLLRNEMNRNRYERSLIKGMNTDAILEELRVLMEEEKIFCNEDISLKSLASELSMTPHQFSELLNSRLNMNFKTFINNYRVEEARKLLREEPERSVLSIGFAVGFNSRSNFNAVFLKYTGQSPSAFREKILRNVQRRPYSPAPLA